MLPLTFAVTLADWSENQDMLRMMLASLKRQTRKDFNVILVDHHYQARKGAVRELRGECDFEVLHMPHFPAPHVAKRYMDCSVFNAGWVMSEAERCVRFSEWRFLKSDFVATLLAEKAEAFVDFYFHEIPEGADVWDRERARIKWENVGDYPEKFELFFRTPSNCFANNALSRELWLDVNGFNEVSFNFFHWEDIDYDARCGHAGYSGKRIPNQMFRIHHQYGSLQNRAKREMELPFKSLCARCEATHSKAVNEIGAVSHPQWVECFSKREGGMGKVEQNGKTWMVCEDCNFIFPALPDDDIVAYASEDKHYKRSPINVSGSGRNLRRLSDDLKGKRWEEKIEIFNASWTNPRYLEEDVEYGL